MTKHTPSGTSTASGSAADVASVPEPAREAGAPKIRNHRRFALTDVTLEAESVGGATLDVWRNSDDAQRWSVRLVMPTSDVPPTGTLAGKLRDGRLVRGRVALVGPGQEFRGRRGLALIEWMGVGTLRTETSAEV